MLIQSKECPDFHELMEIFVERTEQHNMKCLRVIKENSDKLTKSRFEKLIDQANLNMDHARRMRECWLGNKKYFDAIQSLDVLYLCTGHLVRSCEEAGVSVPFS